MPAEEDAVGRARRHFVVAAVDHPAAPVAFGVGAVDPNPVVGVVDRGVDAQVAVPIEAEAEELVPSLPEQDDSTVETPTLRLHALHLPPAVPRPTNVYSNVCLELVNLVVKGRAVPVPVLPFVCLRGDIVGRAYVAQDSNLRSTSLSRFLSPGRLTCDRIDQPERDRTLYVNIQKLKVWFPQDCSPRSLPAQTPNVGARVRAAEAKRGYASNVAV
mmetsp:Transcript_119453/g.309895  ORF Transcript_119453/g.309895 Transcript_119453/m.309895 type:complete len:215 (+) Transcript_119453:369-1013(+)